MSIWKAILSFLSRLGVSIGNNPKPIPLPPVHPAPPTPQAAPVPLPPPASAPVHIPDPTPTIPDHPTEPQAKIPPRGAWIWKVSDMPDGYLDILAKQGCKRIYLKVLDDASAPMIWKDHADKDLINSIKAMGMEVWGWGYHFDQRKVIDVQETVNWINYAIKQGITGYVFDLEVECEDPATHAQVKELLMKMNKEAVAAVTLAYTTFCYPDLHPGFPYSICQEYTDQQMPQAYWSLQRTGPESIEKTLGRVKDVMDTHKNLGLNKKPIYPIFCSEPGEGIPATVEEVQACFDAYAGSSLWRVPGVGETGVAFKVFYATKHETVPTPVPVPSPQPTPTTPTISLNKKIFNFYSQRANYDKVYNNVMSWYGTTSNGCAAFCSSALRLVGLAVPHGNGPGGYDISLVAQSLAEWLISQGWVKMTDASKLRPGDVIVSEDDPNYPGFAAHIYVAGSADKNGYVSAIDNQAFMYSRNLRAGSKTPMAYFLRARS